MIQFLPIERQDQALVVSERIGGRLGAWARGEAVLAAIIGGMTWVGALLLGLPYAAALALIAGVGELCANLARYSPRFRLCWWGYSCPRRRVCSRC